MGKSGVKFSMDKLEYFNSMHIRNRFEARPDIDPTESWRMMLSDHLPKELHSIIKEYDTTKMRKIMDLMKIRIHFYKDMANHAYFFRDPIYESAIAVKFLSKLK